MIEGVFGGIQNFQVNNITAGKNSTNSAFTGAEFKNAMMDIARSANMSITDKGIKEELNFSKWRDLEENLYFNPEEEKEDTAREHLKKLKRILKEKFSS
ncbi:MAG: hypothetical protein KKA31_00330 [Candidatus Margulisbacteria bacterium]|nr:hypothetical protein [Candidatus Margulisiibacteriota bacterium]